jgi:hypothetical protein
MAIACRHGGRRCPRRLVGRGAVAYASAVPAMSLVAIPFFTVMLVLGVAMSVKQRAYRRIYWQAYSGAPPFFHVPYRHDPNPEVDHAKQSMDRIGSLLILCTVGFALTYILT